MKANKVKAPIPYEEAEPQVGPDDEQGFESFVDSLAFRRRLNDPDFPEKGTGMHVPLWVTPKLAQELLGQHGKSGYVIPHQDDDLS